MSSKLIDTFENLNARDKIGHAFLICNTNFSSIKDQLTYILENYIVKDKVDIISNQDIYFIEPTGASLTITKDQLVELQNNLKTTSQVSKNKIYIISQCEKMNPYASNSLLKILEEPQSNIIAFLISENVNNVIETIKSRCQILFIPPEEKKENIYTLINEEKLINIIKFIKNIESYKEKAIAFNTFNEKDLSKESLKKYLNIVEYFYRDCLNIKTGFSVEYFTNDINDIEFVSNNNSISQLTKKLLVINKIIEKIDYNLNQSMLLDRLIINMGRCKDE